jgi:hypothetical protein
MWCVIGLESNAPRLRATMPRVSDTWPPPGPQKPERCSSMSRLVDPPRYPGRLHASIWETTFGVKLRVEHRGVDQIAIVTIGMNAAAAHR